MPDLLRPPAAPRRPTLRSHHGDDVVDEYAWMADRSDPEFTSYLRAENDWADARTAHLASVRETIVAEITSRVQQSDVSVPVASGPWWYYTRTIEGESYPVHARCPRAPGAGRPQLDATHSPPGEQVIVDGNREARGHDYLAIGILTLSPDHRLAAIGLDVRGDERFDVRIVEVATGEVLDTALTGVGYGAVFSLDGTHLLHTRVDDAWRPHEVWCHRVGGDPDVDVRVHHEPDERFWISLDVSRDDRWILISQGSRTTSQVHLLDAAAVTAAPRAVCARQAGLEYEVEPAGDHLLVVHNRDNEDFDLAWAPLDCTSTDQWRPLLRSGPGQRFLGVDAFERCAVLTLRDAGMTALSVLPLAEAEPDPGPARYGAPRPVDVAEAVRSLALADNPEPGSTRLLLAYETFTTPRSILELDLDTETVTLVKQQPVPGGVDLAEYRQRQLCATAADGTQIPISLVTPADADPDATGALLLTAYGSYETSLDPYFSPARLSLLDRGVAYAVAHVRGGGELGRAWYDQGKLTAKRTTFTDLVTCARHLVTTGWVASDRLALSGGSAGGLLVGAAVNLAPALFRVAHADVPFVDPLTTILDPDLPLTVGEWEEWGDPLHDPEVYAYMKSYTPYENLAATRYPAILATTSLNDTRVFATEPAKWVARLRHTVTNDPVRRPILLRTEMVAGHGGVSGRYAAWEQLAWEWAFVLDQLGATTRSATGSRSNPSATGRAHA